MMDLSQMSDEELEKIAGGQSEPTELDYSTMSNEELEKIANPPPAVEKPSTKGVAALQGFGSGLSLGYAPHLQAVAEKPLAKLYDWVYGTDVSDSIDDDYVKRRDAWIKREKQLAEENPLAFGASNVAGAVVSGLAVPGSALTTGGGKVAAAASNAVKAGAFGGRMARAGLQGAALSGLANPGDVEGEMGGLQVGDRAANAWDGFKLGALGTGGGEAVGRGAGLLGKSLRGAAEAKAFKSSGAMLKDFRTANDRNMVNKLGRFMLDNGLVKAGDTFDDVAGKAKLLSSQAGDRLDDVYNRAAASGKPLKAGFDPIRDKSEILAAARRELGDSPDASGALQKLSDYLDEIGARHGDAPNQAAKAKYQDEVNAFKPKFRDFLREKRAYQEALGEAGSDLSQPILPGMSDDLQRTKMQQRQFEINGKPAEVLKPAAAEPLMNQPFLPDLPTRDSTTARIFADEVDPFWETIAKRGSRVGDELLPGEQQAFLNQNTAEQISMFGKQGELAGTGLTPRSFSSADVPAIVSGKGQTSMLLPPEAPIRPQRPVTVRNPMSVRRTNDIKGAMDDVINYARNPLSKEPAKEAAFSAARKVLSGKIDDSIAEVSPELLDELKAANRDYGYSKQIGNIANDRVSREAANRFMSPSDYWVSGVGAIGGAMTGDSFEKRLRNAAVGGSLGVMNQAARKYGNPLLATGLDKMASGVSKIPSVTGLAAKSPIAYQAGIQSLASDRPFVSGDLLERAEANPGVLNQITNPRLRDALEKAIEKRRAEQMGEGAQYTPEERIDGASARQKFLAGN